MMWLIGVLSVELIWLIIGLVWVIQHYKACPASTAKQAIFGKPEFISIAVSNIYANNINIAREPASEIY